MTPIIIWWCVDCLENETVEGSIALGNPVLNPYEDGSRKYEGWFIGGCLIGVKERFTLIENQKQTMEQNLSLPHVLEDSKPKELELEAPFWDDIEFAE